MTLQEIKQQMDAQHISMKQLADLLCVKYDSLRQILAGQRPLTPQLNRHIELTLGWKKDEMVIYRVTVPDEVVERLVPQAGAMPKAELTHILELVLHKNIDELAKLGGRLEWTDAERVYLGLDAHFSEGAFMAAEDD